MAVLIVNNNELCLIIGQGIFHFIFHNLVKAAICYSLVGFSTIRFDECFELNNLLHCSLCYNKAAVESCHVWIPIYAGWLNFWFT